MDIHILTDQSIPGWCVDLLAFSELPPACEHLMPFAVQAFEAGSCKHSLKLWSIVLPQFIDKARSGFRAWVTQQFAALQWVNLAGDLKILNAGYANLPGITSVAVQLLMVFLPGRKKIKYQQFWLAADRGFSLSYFKKALSLQCLWVFYICMH